MSILHNQPIRIRLWHESHPGSLKRWEALPSLLTYSRIEATLGVNVSPSFTSSATSSSSSFHADANGAFETKSDREGDKWQRATASNWNSLLQSHCTSLQSHGAADYLIRFVSQPQPQQKQAMQTQEKSKDKKKHHGSARHHIEKYRFRGDWSKESHPHKIDAAVAATLPPVIRSPPASAHSTPTLGARKLSSGSEEEWTVLDDYGAPAGSFKSSSSAPVVRSARVARTTLQFPHQLVAKMRDPPRFVSEKSASPNATVTFTINTLPYTVVNPDPSLKLAPFLREQVGLTGTKIGCGEGGCGACMVLLSYTDALGVLQHKSINSCLHLVAQMDGVAITTIEGLGSEREGLHPIQKSIVKNSATQCGYCTPGFTMSMYGLLANNPTPSQQDVEDRFDGNICRCTGYRPIFDAMRQVIPSASDNSQHGEESKEQVPKQGCKSGSSCGSSSSSCSSSSASKPPLVPCGKGNGGSCSSSAKDSCASKGTCCGDMEDLMKFNANNPKHLRPVVFPAKNGNNTTGATWTTSPWQIFITPTLLADAQQLMSFYATQSGCTIQLVNGNTAQGIAKYYSFNSQYDQANVCINIAQLAELQQVSVVQGVGLSVGAGTSLTAFQAALKTNATGVPASNTSSWPKLIYHIDRIASQSIRSVASIAGNLFLAKAHPQFPSDILTTLSGACATLTIAGLNGTRSIPVSSLQSTNFAPDELILNVIVPYTTAQQSYDSFKCRARNQLSPPLANGAFLFTYTGSKDSQGFPIIQDTTIALGGLPINANVGVFLASKTSAFLQNKSLNPTTLAGAIVVLQQETTASAAHKLALASGPTSAFPIKTKRLQSSTYSYAEEMALNLFYKFFIGELQTNMPSMVPARITTATEKFVRGVSSSVQAFTPDPSTAPVGAAVTKLEAPAQATGEAKYTNDESLPLGGLHGSLVRSTVAAGTITSIDASAALSMDGVVKFISAADIASLGPAGSGAGGSNSCGAFPGDEEVFASKNIFTQGQSIGMILAHSQEVANKAALLVKVTYGAPATPAIIDIDAAVAAKSFLPDNQYQQNTPPLVRGTPSTAIQNAPNKISGSLYSAGQYHFSMETQSSFAIPRERDVIELYCASQGVSDVRASVAQCLNQPANKVIVTTKRCGGAYGNKLSRSHPLACAVAIASTLTRLPVKSQSERWQDAVMWGKRPEFRIDYQIGFDSTGAILGVIYTMYQQGGYSYEENLGINFMAVYWSDNAYYIPNFSATGIVCRTNTPSNTSMRGPGVTASVYAAEMMVERIAWALKMDPLAVRMKNFYTEGQLTPYLEPVTQITMSAVLTALQKQSNYATTVASVAAYNTANRWRKRGVHIATVKYGISDGGSSENIVMLLNICVDDGSIQVSHNGVELGQGINTKVIQTVAYELSQLGFPITTDMIEIGPNSSNVLGNSSMTGGSSTSEACCQVAIQAVAELSSRLKPVLSSGGSGIKTWAQLITAAHTARVNLQVSSQYLTPDVPPTQEFTYWVYCASCAVVELDVLTGAVQIESVDIVYDCGDSLSPYVDIGQIEGGFMQGVGHFLTEEVLYDSTSGVLTTPGTLAYHVPSSQDIPMKFNVSLLPKAPNAAGILSSKASAEPPVPLAMSVYLALRDCIASARAEVGNTDWFDLPTPANVQKVQELCLVTPPTLVL